MNRDRIVDYLDALLSPQDFEDATYNGLQVEGNNEIGTVCFAVDTETPVIQAAIDQKANMLVVHHGLIWGSWKNVTAYNKERLSLLLKHDINLYVSHLPLDKHKLLGNNVGIISLLGASIQQEALEVACIAELPKTMTRADFHRLLTHKIGLNGSMEFGKNLIRHILVSSGSFRPDQINNIPSCDAIITGEGSSPSLCYYPAKVSSQNIYFCGHYATEIFGVQSLMQSLLKQFPVLNAKFLDFPTGW